MVTTQEPFDLPDDIDIDNLDVSNLSYALTNPEGIWYSKPPLEYSKFNTHVIHSHS